MHAPSRNLAGTWIALFAALAQLWLGTLHARPDAAVYCGDGSAGRSAALLQQLPPELRLPLDRLDRAKPADCAQCALACAAALPPAVATLAAAGFTHAAPDVRRPRPALAAFGRRTPPARAPPATH